MGKQETASVKLSDIESINQPKKDPKIVVVNETAENVIKVVKAEPKVDPSSNLLQMQQQQEYQR